MKKVYNDPSSAETYNKHNALQVTQANEFLSDWEEEIRKGSRVLVDIGSGDGKALAGIVEKYKLAFIAQSITVSWVSKRRSMYTKLRFICPPFFA